jgi:sporulation protein YlmC with PRC-barrel domain
MVAEAAPLKQRTKGHVATASGGTDRKSCYCAPLLTQEARMPEAIQTHATRGPSHPLIESNRIEGTRVFAKDGKHIGTIDHLVIEKVNGRVVYAVMRFGGFLGVGGHQYTVPWSKLTYDPKLAGFHTDITEAELQDAPHLPHDSDRDQRKRCYATGASPRTGCK